MFVLTPQLATTLTITQILNMFAKVLKRMEYSDSQNVTCLNTHILFTSFGSFLAVFHSKCRWMIILDQFNWLISCERTSFCWFLMSTRPKYDMKICGMFICTIFFSIVKYWLHFDRYTSQFHGRQFSMIRKTIWNTYKIFDYFSSYVLKSKIMD